MTYHRTLPRRRGIVTVRAEPNVNAVLASLTTGFENFRAKVDGRLDTVQAAVDEALRLYGALAVGGTGEGPANDGSNMLADFAAALRDNTGRNLDVGPEDLARYATAEAAYWRLGPQALGAAMADMSSGADGEGGFTVTPQRSGRIRKRMFDTSPIRRIANVETISGDTWEELLDVDDIESGGWVSERGSRSDTESARIGLQKIAVHEQYAQPAVTQRLLEDSSVDIGGHVESKIADKFARIENTAFVTGNGVGKPRGFLDYKAAAVTTDDDTRAWGVLQYVPSGAAGGFPTLSGIPGAADADALVQLQMSLQPQYLPGAVWMMKRATGRVVRTLKDGDGRFLWNDSLVAGQPPMLLGHPVVYGEDMPALASDSFSIAFGDFNAGYTIIDRLGLSVLRDPYTSKGKVKFYARKRVGGDVVDFNAIKLLKMAAS